MTKYLYIFEDDDYENFFPLSATRPAFCLRLGIDLLYEKWQTLLPVDELRFCLRDDLSGLISRSTGIVCNKFSGVSEGGALMINGRYLAERSFADKLTGLEKSCLVIDEGCLAAALILPGTKEADDLEQLNFWGYGHFKEIIKALQKVDCRSVNVKHIWDFISLNPEQIRKDFELSINIGGKTLSGHGNSISDHSLIYNQNNVSVGNDVRIDGQTVIDARKGPVIVDDGAIIEPHSRIVGPCYIGRSSMIVGGRIREGCSIGPVCRVGGEVEETIFLGCSNKFHDGFIGHSYVGEWVNLGAGTTNSDLKNNYGTVRVDLGFGLVDTGMLKVGSFVGDHVKTGIGTLLNTGISIGFAANIFGGGLAVDKCIPPFCWGNSGSYDEYMLDKAIATARVVMERRGVGFTKRHEKLFSSIFEQSSRYRAEFLG